MENRKVIHQEDKKEVSIARIMSYYNPKWLAYLGFVTSGINAFAFPIFGLIFSKILFIMMVPSDPNYKSNRDFWCGMFLLESCLIGLFSFLQKYVFLYVGENLTCDIRKELFRGIIYK
jgi:ABC-type multidrug transport system fused ATPase/permease subunit